MKYVSIRINLHLSPIIYNHPYSRPSLRMCQQKALRASRNMNSTNTNQQNNNNESTNDDKTQSQTSFLLTNEMKVSLPLDNSTIHTTQQAVQKFNGILSEQNVKDLTQYVIDGRTPINTPTITTIVANLKDKNNITISGVKSTQGNPVGTSNLGIEIETVEGGYKFTSDESKLTTILEKRLENDLGQQSEEGNRVFRSNVYTSMDVDSVMALQGKSRLCKTMEVLSELTYAYDPTSSNGVSNNNIFIFDYLDYNNTIIREMVNRHDPAYVITISETNSNDVKLAIARTAHVIGYFGTHDWIIVLSNCKNPLTCERCVLTYEDKPVDTNYSKLRYAQAANLHAHICKDLNYLQNTSIHLYSFADVYNWNSVSVTRSKCTATTYSASYVDADDFDSEITGANITLTTYPSLPLSRQKHNIQDYYTAIHALVEMKYRIKTPYGNCNFDFTVTNTPTIILPICDVGIRIARDKNMCKPLITETYAIEHRGLLANKLLTLAKYRAGRLLATITEVFGSLYNCRKLLNDLALFNSFWQIIDAQTVGIYKDEHLIGLVGHKRYDVTTYTSFITTKIRSTGTNSFTGVADPTNDNLTVEEYYPLAMYWRSDVFGLPEHDEYAYENKVCATTYVGYYEKYDDKIYYVSNGNVGRCQYQTTAGQYVNCDVLFISNYAVDKTVQIGMYSVPTVFKSKYFSNYVHSPLDKAQNNSIYPVSYGSRVYTSEIVKQDETSLESVLFG